MFALSRVAPSRFVLYLLCLFLAGGCSVVRLSYNHLDSVALWMAQDYFDLHGGQRDDVARRFDRLHTWHRREVLPEYARFLKDVQQRAARGLHAGDVLWVVDDLKQHYARIAAHSAADVADLLVTLTPTQIDTFKQQIDKDNREFREEHRTDEGEVERRRALERRALSRLQDWVGSLSEEQETQIVALLRQVPLADALRHRDRLRRQREFLALLELRHGDRVQFARQVRDWLVHWESGRSTEDAQRIDAAWQRRADFYAAVDRLLTTAQRGHLLHRLQDYIDDLQTLSEPRPAPAS